jgi:hypothetical protein
VTRSESQGLGARSERIAVLLASALEHRLPTSTISIAGSHRA